MQLAKGPWRRATGIAVDEEEHVVYLRNEPNDSLILTADDVANVVNWALEHGLAIQSRGGHAITFAPNSIPVRVDAFVHLSLLADHARELVQVHREGWSVENATEAELVDAIAEDLEHIPPAVRA